MSAELSKEEILDWTIDQLGFSGCFDWSTIRLWRGLALHQRVIAICSALGTIPVTERLEIAERFDALGANRKERDA